jgi:peptidoglycan/xylan/chitin deacetylase (PgdA/CDA1 family)
LVFNLKRSAKGAALETARLSASIGAGFVSRRLLAPIKIDYDPPVATGKLYPGNKRAAACVSIDFDVTVEDRYQANRVGTKTLLELSEKYGVPLTWAICGMTADADRESYERILNSPTRQEIGIHTYSHIDAQKCDAGEFEKDIVRCIEALNLGSTPPTFIFPWNRVNHFPILRSLGFKVYRGKERAVGAPTPSEGLYNIRPVYYVDQKSFGAQSLINKYADLCASASSVFHLWTHPWSIVMHDGGTPMVETLDPVFSHLRKMSDRGELALCTMGELAEHFQATNAQKVVLSH